MNKRVLQSCLREAVKKLSTDSRSNETNLSHYHHYSFVIIRNEIIEWGRNRQLKVPLHWGYDNSFQGLHSEMAAYKKASGILGNSDFDMVNIRLSKKLFMLNSMPCEHCQRMLRELGCGHIWFSTEYGFEKLKL